MSELQILALTTFFVIVVTTIVLTFFILSRSLELYQDEEALRIYASSTRKKVNILPNLPDDVVASFYGIGVETSSSTADSSTRDIHARHAADVWAMRTMDDGQAGKSGILFASRNRQAFVMLAHPRTSAASILADLRGSQTLKYVCVGPGAELALRWVAASYGKNVDIDVRKVSRSEDIGDYDAICYFTHPRPSSWSKSKSEKPKSDSRGPVAEIIDYASGNENLKAILEIKAPFIECRGLFVRDVYERYPASQHIMEFMSTHDLVMVPLKVVREFPREISIVSQRLARDMDMDALARNTLHAMRFRYVNAMQDAMRARTQLLMMNSTRETFVESSTELNPMSNVPTRVKLGYDGAVRLMELRPGTLNGMPLRCGDRVVLSNQDRPAENGKYIVLERTPSRAILTDRVPVAMGPDARLIIDDAGCHTLISTNGKRIRELDVLNCQDGDLVYVPQRRWNGVVGGGGHIVNLSCSQDAASVTDAEKFHPRALCFQGGRIRDEVDIKELCEDRVDAMGLPKEPGVWDRPCEVDADCPFFGANAMYDNKRGGCQASGYCEMPRGMRQISYRKAVGRPMCHGCPEDHDVHCCSTDGPNSKILKRTVAFDRPSS